MNIKYISFLVVSVLLIMAACKNEPKAASTTTDPAAATSTQPTPVSAPANVTAPPNFTPTTAPAAEPAQRGTDRAIHCDRSHGLCPGRRRADHRRFDGVPAEQHLWGDSLYGLRLFLVVADPDLDQAFSGHRAGRSDQHGLVPADVGHVHPLHAGWHRQLPAREAVRVRLPDSALLPAGRP